MDVAVIATQQTALATTSTLLPPGRSSVHGDIQVIFDGGMAAGQKVSMEEVIILIDDDEFTACSYGGAREVFPQGQHFPFGGSK